MLTLKVVLSPLVNVIVFPAALAVTTAFGVLEAVLALVANDADVAILAVDALVAFIA
jgi:hypothetical protein